MREKIHPDYHEITVNVRMALLIKPAQLGEKPAIQ